MGISRRSTAAYENFTIERIVFFQSLDSEGFDITDIFKSFSIYEGISQGLLKGTLEFVDFMNLINSINPRGDEKVQISFRSVHLNGVDAKTYSKIFKVTRYEDITNPNTQTQKFVRLHLVSEQDHKNEYSRISKSYKGTSIHAIVSDMLRVIGFTDETIFVEPTLYNRDIVIPNLTPISVINFLASSAQSSDVNSKGDSNFYFYEDVDGAKFRTGTSMMVGDPVVDLIFEATHDTTMYNKIIKMQRVKGYNIPEQYRNGGLGVNVHSMSFDKKLYTNSYQDYTSVKDVYPTLNPEPWFGGDIKPERNACVYFTTEDQMYKYINMGSNGNSLGIRATNRTSLNAKRMLIQVAGNSDLSCGQVVNIIAGDMNGEMTSKDAGRWLINSINHVCTQGSYIMNLELISDSDTRGKDIQ
ncbi:hypothetical protein [Aeromonas phage AS-yj]|uniref:Uncharacterized protein n=1 Tax=Aeromonas phage AS-yj TaxID=2026115 RepID=A0A291LF93_9CAUD|nr:hypothetical protein [Aeromonas phage AS-yj]